MHEAIRQFLDSLDAEASEEERRQAAMACASALGLGGMAVSLGQELVWFSDRMSARLEDLQFVLGQGPLPAAARRSTRNRRRERRP
ncbi:hypothetical protein ACFYVL_09635 [Streptomyces sp. NPDC004111]|uniref:hypothetical protein n=1 Tax=Streptomyces sp. NPDC004111 TaxID=3364690 RepID=UPI0036B0064E